MRAWLNQLAAVTAMNLRNLPARLGTSLVAVVGIGGVVAVLVSLLSMGEGFRAALDLSGRDDVALVLAEAVLITVLGGAIGLAGAWWLGVQFEPVFAQYLPGFSLQGEAVLMGVAFMLGLGLVAGAVPALQAMQLRIVDALRRE